MCGRGMYPGVGVGGCGGGRGCEAWGEMGCWTLDGIGGMGCARGGMDAGFGLGVRGRRTQGSWEKRTVGGGGGVML